MRAMANVKFAYSWRKQMTQTSGKLWVQDKIMMLNADPVFVTAVWP